MILTDGLKIMARFCNIANAHSVPNALLGEYTRAILHDGNSSGI